MNNRKSPEVAMALITPFNYGNKLSCGAEMNCKNLVSIVACMGFGDLGSGTEKSLGLIFSRPCRFCQWCT